MKRRSRIIYPKNKLMIAAAWVIGIASFIVLIWLVQQTRAQHVLISKILIQTAPVYQTWESKKIKQQTSTRKQNKQEDVNQPKAPPSTKETAKKSAIPKASSKLLNDAYTMLKEARKNARSGKHNLAINDIQTIKDKIWKAGDMLPTKAKMKLRKLMGPLDYSKSQLIQNKEGNLLTPMRTIKEVLNGAI